MSLILVTPPAADPVSAPDLMLQLGMTPSTQAGASDFLASQLEPHIATATADVQDYCRRALVLQSFEWHSDRLPWHSREYRDHDRRFPVPMPPLLAIDSFRYVDLTGTWQDLPLDTTYGTGPNLPLYGYQLIAGGEQPAWIKPQRHSLWPLTAGHADTVIIRFRAGYGGTIALGITLTQTNGQPVTQTTGYTFAQGDVGKPLSIPGAGGTSQVAAPLVTTIASVDPVSGNATLAQQATTAVATTQAYYGLPVPQPLVAAIKFLAQFYYEQDVVSATDWPPFVTRKLAMYRNLIS